MKSELYDLKEKITQNPIDFPNLFQLHVHDQYEILLFLEGDSNYIIEDRSYPLEPYDLTIVRKHQLHHMHHNSATPYHRIVLFVEPSFFTQFKCEEYELHFANITTNIGNKIPASIVRSSGIYDAFMELKKYSENYTINADSPILHACIIKILYLIHKTNQFSLPEYPNETVSKVIQYLNNHFTENITLDILAEKFFISKYHLCKVFVNATGLTIHKYIQLKRFVMVRELYTEGMSLLDASLQAGFLNYSSFYRAYTNEYGVSPTKDLT